MEKRGLSTCPERRSVDESESGRLVLIRGSTEPSRLSNPVSQELTASPTESCTRRLISSFPAFTNSSMRVLNRATVPLISKIPSRWPSESQGKTITRNPRRTGQSLSLACWARPWKPSLPTDLHIPPTYTDSFPAATPGLGNWPRLSMPCTSSSNTYTRPGPRARWPSYSYSMCQKHTTMSLDNNFYIISRNT
ncbi:hypothetical protein I7I48_07875 [Histoplasma ohiense]|nr:hypothetical protein I7I48_07875 [Histoplasma ohiense (nom. inval.)]